MKTIVRNKFCITFFLILFSGLFVSNYAQTVYTWNCNAVSPPTSGSNSNITVGSWSQGNNNGTTPLISTTSASSGYAGASGTSNFGAAARAGNLNTGSNGSAYFEITLTPSTGYALTLNSIAMGSRSTSTAPQQISILTDVDSYGNAIGNVSVSNNSSWALVSTTLTGLGAVGSVNTPITLRIYGHNGTGSPSTNTANWRIDDITLNVTANTPATTPTISTNLSTLSYGNTTVGQNSDSQSFTVSGSNLTAGVTVTAPASFQVSTDDEIFSSGFTLGQSGGTLTGQPVTVYVRFAPGSAGLKEGFITLNSADAEEKTVSVSGTGVAPIIGAPVAVASTSISQTSFTANWDEVEGATSYRLDVATNSLFSQNIENLDVLVVSNSGTVGAEGWVETAVEQRVATGNNYLGLLSNTSTLITPEMDLSNFSAISLDFLARTFGGVSGSSNVITVSVSTNNGSSWTTLGTRTPTSTTLVSMSSFDLSLYSSTSVRVRFQTLNATGSVGVGIDDILISGDEIINNSFYVLGYENLLVNGLSQEVTGLTEGSTYYYRVRAFDGTTSENSNTISVITAVAPATFGSIMQVAPVCDGETATFNVSGLLPQETTTLTYQIDGSDPVSVNISTGPGGTGSFQLPLAFSLNGVALTVLSVARDGIEGTSTTVTENNVEVLEVTAQPTWYLDADLDGYYTGEPVVSCASPGAGYTTTVLPGGDCDDSNAAVNPGATEVCFDGIDNNCDGSLNDGCPLVVTALEAVHNNQILPQMGTTLRAVNPNYTGPFANTLLYRFRVTNLSTGAVETLTRSVRFFQLIMFTPGFYTFETSYSIEVALVINDEEQPYGIARTVTTPSVPTTQVVGSLCGNTLAAIDTRINVVQVNSATLYRFKVSKVGLPSDERIVENTYYGFKLNTVPTSPGEVGYVSYNSSYLVSAQVRVVIDGEEVWSDYGAVCTVSTPDLPTTFIADAYCDLEVSNKNQRIYATWFSGATQYRFLLEEVEAGEGDDEEIILYSQTRTQTTNYFTLNMFTGLQLGTTYRVRVALGFNGVFGPYGSGKDCSVTYVTAEEPKPLMRATAEASTSMTNFSAVAYPNPFADSFNLDIKANATVPITIVVYDMMGRLLESKNITIDQANTTNIGASYPTGVYNVVVTQGEDVKMVRVVKQ